MVMIRRIINKFFPVEVKIALSYLQNYNTSPYNLNFSLFPEKSISDFFVFDKDCLRIGFIAENIRAMILGQEIPITHNFKFFSMNGVFLGTQSYQTKEFFKEIILKPLKTNDKYYSFIHYVESEIDLDHILRDKGISRSLKFSEQNRGYSIYYHSNSEFGSVVHGNFGGITKDLKKTARKTLLSHVYTPIYKFEKLSNYDLVFNNPTSSSIIIKIFFNNSSRIIDLIIPSLGTRFLRIKNYSGSCSFESRLPICRALVFKNPTPNFSGTFDIFHS